MPMAVATNIVFERRKASMRSRTIAEVVIAFGLERFSGKRHFAGFSFHDGSDAYAGEARARRRGVEKLVILPVVQGLRERGAFEQGNFVKRRRYSRGQTEAVEIERQTVANIHAGAGLAREFLRYIEARHNGRFVAPSSERSRDIDHIAGSRAIAPQSLAARHGPAHHDVARNLPGA